MFKLEPAQKNFPFDLKPIIDMMGVYCFTNKMNGMKYVGKSNLFYDRFTGYNGSLKKLSDNNKFVNAVRKYSLSAFTLEILEAYTIDQLNCFLNLNGLTKQEKTKKIGRFLCEREAFWIKNLNTTDRNLGYNLCARSNDSSGIPLTEEHKKKVSEAVKGEKNGFWGKKHDQSLRQKVDQVNPKTGEVVFTWSSVTDILTHYNLPRTKRDYICRVMRGQRKKFKGFGWRRHVDS
jgi:group I intron endonuclease